MGTLEGKLGVELSDNHLVVSVLFLTLLPQKYPLWLKATYTTGVIQQVTLVC